MKKLERYIVAFLIVMVMTVSFGTSVRADSISKVGGSTEDSILIQDNTSTAVSENLARGNILNKGLASIADNENGTVNVYGAVYGSVVCDKMILELTLQRYSNGSWSNVKSFSATAYNTGLLTKSYNVSVAKGYYYRVKAACVAQKGGSSESQMPITDGIWVD